MALTRRHSLKLLGGGAILAATASSAAFLTTRNPTAAQRPWQAAGGYADPRAQALSYGILAPNPHNRQPWIVDLKGSDEMIIYRDMDRNLPETDPFDRQLTIGMGCLLELTAIAAAEQGFTLDLDLFPEGDAGPVATARLIPGAAPDPLFAHILARRSCREPFRDVALTASEIADLAGPTQIITDAGLVAQLRDLTFDAWMIEATTPRTHMESVDLMRFGKAEINANPDGISLGGALLESMMLAGMLTREGQADPTSPGFQQGIEIYRNILMATPAYGVITSAGNSRLDQIQAGRDWARLNLKTTAMGLSLHPVSQALQEFDEMKAHYDRAHRLLAENGETVQMLGRLGHGPDVAAAPRWPLETVINDG